MNLLKDFYYLFQLIYGRILPDVIILLGVDISCQNGLALLVISVDPMIDISQPLLETLEFHQLVVRIENLPVLKQLLDCLLPLHDEADIRQRLIYPAMQ